MTVFGRRKVARTFDYQAGDVGYVPIAMGHYIQNTGDEPWGSWRCSEEHFADVSLKQWMALTPHEVIADTINVQKSIVDSLPNTKQVVI